MHADLEQLLEDGRINKAQADLLNQWQPGGYVKHRSWGAGKITGWDLTQGKLEVDFEEKPDHSMALKFAMKNLDLLDDSHILAQRAQDSGRLTELAASDPKELIVEVVASHGGSITLDRLEETLCGSVIPADEYKSWWEAAKRKMRGDRRFVLPPRRSEPLVVRSGDMDPGTLLVEDLGDVPDLKGKAKVLGQVIGDLDSYEDKSVLIDVISGLEERLETGARGDLAGTLELMLVRDDLSAAIEYVPESRLEVVDVVRDQQKALGEQLRSLPVALLRRVLQVYPEAYGENEWVEVALSQIPGAGPRGVAELARFLDERGETKKLVKKLQSGVTDRGLDQDVLVWICRERDGAGKSLFTMDLAGAILHELERDYYDEEARGGNRLRELVTSDRELLSDLIENATYAQARNFGRRLMGSPAFDDLTRKSLMARLVRIQPRLQELLSVEAEADVDELIVSWTSLSRRKDELDDLVNKQIPENSKEISIAREYGDLRENAEYKAAKEMQAVLMRRKDEMERDLNRAKGTEFANVDTTKVNIGTEIELEPVNDGDTATYFILGAWDGDVDKNILSYQSVAAASMLGKGVGEVVNINGVPHKLVSIKAAKA